MDTAILFKFSTTKLAIKQEKLLHQHSQTILKRKMKILPSLEVQAMILEEISLLMIKATITFWVHLMGQLKLQELVLVRLTMVFLWQSITVHMSSNGFMMLILRREVSMVQTLSPMQ